MIQLIELRGIQPGDSDMDLSDWLIGMGAETMPDFSGQRLADVSLELTHPGGFHVTGGGSIITHHFPEPGALMPDTNPIIFFTDPNTYLEDRMFLVPNVTGLPLEQARFVVNQAYLPYRYIISDQRTITETNAFPHTAQPTPVSELEFAPPPLPPRTVYRQFPEADTLVERGTRVVLRAR